MKVLIDHAFPFLLTHGGFQVQIEQTVAAIKNAGVAAEHLRWWDDQQTGDLIHFFGRPSSQYVQQARAKGVKIVVSELLTEPGSRSAIQRAIQKNIIRGAKALVPNSFIARFAWDSLRTADACVALTPWEAKLLRDVFDVPPEAIHVIPNGVEDVFFETPPEERGKWLVCTATITERKRVLETAEAAVLGKTPFWVIGRPYSEASPYAVRFRRLHEQHRELIRFEGPVHNRSDLARVYRQARGFVLLSTMESLSLSALEAAACQCPLLLADLPWARGHFAQHARYCDVSATTRHTAAALRRFYDEAPQLPPPPTPQRWADVGASLRSIYEALLRNSR